MYFFYRVVIKGPFWPRTFLSFRNIRICPSSWHSWFLGLTKVWNKLTNQLGSKLKGIFSVPSVYNKKKLYKRPIAPNIFFRKPSISFQTEQYAAYYRIQSSIDHFVFVLLVHLTPSLIPGIQISNEYIWNRKNIQPYNPLNYKNYPRISKNTLS